MLISRGRRVWLLALAASCTSLATLVLSNPADGQSVPSGCTDISSVPPLYSGIQYGAAIQANIFVHFAPDGSGCADCHTSNMGANTPSGNLDLDPSETTPYFNLLNVASDEDPNLLYVVPNHPELSLLFQKVNCDNPAVGNRMPLFGYGGGLTADQQALIYDWIAEGAPIGTTDGVFRNGFDIRGFAQ
jgi:hypothetical protein